MEATLMMLYTHAVALFTRSRGFGGGGGRGGGFRGGGGARTFRGTGSQLSEANDTKGVLIALAAIVLTIALVVAYAWYQERRATLQIEREAPAERLRLQRARQIITQRRG